MTIVVYSSNDVSAPAYTGAAGSIIGLLDACLVSGYGTKPALGWAKEFNTLNIGVYRAASGNRFRLRVDDTADTNAYCRAYETMTAHSTGTQPFPTITQLANGSGIPKGSGVTPRSWKLVGSSSAFYLYVSPVSSGTLFSGANAFSDRVLFFGDGVSNKPGDAFFTMLIGSSTYTSVNDTFGAVVVTNSPSGTDGHYVARPHTQLGGSCPAFKTLPIHGSVIGPIGVMAGNTSKLSVPDPVSGEIIFLPIEIYEFGSDSIPIRRGRLPGAWSFPHNLPFGFLSEFPVTGDINGKIMLCLPANYAANPGQFTVEISPINSW